MNSNDTHKINMLFDAAVLEYNNDKKSARSGIFFVAYNILKEFSENSIFNITLCAQKGKIIRKIKKDHFLSSFKIIKFIDKEVVHLNSLIQRERMQNTKNTVSKLICVVKIL